MPWPLPGPATTATRRRKERGKPAWLSREWTSCCVCLRIARQAGVPKVIIDNHVMVRRHIFNPRKHRPRRLARARKSRNRRRRGERACPFHRIQPIHSTARPAPGNESSGALDAIVSARHHLQHQPPQASVRGRKPAAKQAHQRLWTFHQFAYSLVAVRSLRIGGEIGQVVFHFRVDLLPRLAQTAADQSNGNAPRGPGR